MSNLRTLVRLRRWTLEDKQRQLSQLQIMATGLGAQIARLEQDIPAQQDALAEDANVGMTLGPFVRASLERRERLEQSRVEVQARIEAMRAELSEAFAELKRYEITENRRVGHRRQEAERRERIVEGEIAFDQYRTKSRASAAG